jgi:hypothetical protein
LATGIQASPTFLLMPDSLLSADFDNQSPTSGKCLCELPPVSLVFLH